QKSAVLLDEVIPSKKAQQLANDSKIDPRVAQLVMQESDEQIFGSVFHAILAKTPYGLSANAGIDLSNSPDGYALLLPRDPNGAAKKFMNEVKNKFNINVAVLIIDSRTIPLRKGTTAVTLGVAGMNPIIDERGKEDLYGEKMVITTRAIADSVATAVNMIMGETNEQSPFGIMRGIEYERADDVSMFSALMPEDQCLYFAPFIKLLNREDQ
ncbi:MAG: coenzyme F420-0:L-glutamate ligase, partial [Candidatus Kariarchaeaceae archaeon]